MIPIAPPAVRRGLEKQTLPQNPKIPAGKCRYPRQRKLSNLTAGMKNVHTRAKG